MPRPRVPRLINFQPSTYYFKACRDGVKKYKVVFLRIDEVEAIKLYEIDNHDQISAAKKMMISQPTFARLLRGAHKKIAEALIFGKCIRIENIAVPQGTEYKKLINP